MSGPAFSSARTTARRTTCACGRVAGAPSWTCHSADMPAASRPRLQPHARLLRRGPGAVQVGTRPGAGVVLEGLTDAEVAFLRRLDGSSSTTHLYADAAAEGADPRRLRLLLDVLRQCRLLLDEPADRATLRRLGGQWREVLEPEARTVSEAYATADDGYAIVRRRRGQRVLVVGAGALTAAVAELLRGGGVGTVLTGALAGELADFGLRGHDAEPMPDLVVLVACEVLDPAHALSWRRRGVAQLPVVLSGQRVAVGPVLTPESGPCLQCMDLHRSDLDPAWPMLRSQLVADVFARPAPATTSTALTSVAAGLAAGLAQARLDGRPLPADVSVEVGVAGEGAWPQVGYRRWERHPRCDCEEVGAARGRAG